MVWLRDGWMIMASLKNSGELQNAVEIANFAVVTTDECDMNGPAARFLQRLESYGRALAKLDELVGWMSDRPEFAIFDAVESGLQMEMVRESLIKRFEFTQELSWNLLKDYLLYQGETEVAGSRDVYRRALRFQLIESHLWLQMILDRNISAHDYNDMRVAEIADRILNDYHPLLMQLKDDMQRRAKDIPEEDR